MTPEEVANIQKILSSSPEVTRFDVPGEPQSATIAHAAADISESCEKLIHTLYPKLARCGSPGNVVETLHEIGEEYRHIIYHIKDQKFFEYVL